MKTLKSLFRRGQGPPSATGARNAKRGANGSGDQLSIGGPPSLNGAPNSALGPGGPGDMVASRSTYGSADLPKQVDNACDGTIAPLKGAASVSSLDSKHHKLQLPKQLRSSRSSSGEKSRPPGIPDSSGALQPVANNNNNINNNHNRRKTSVGTMDLEVVALQGELEKVSKDKEELKAKVADLISQQSELQTLREEVTRLREKCKMEVEQSVLPRSAQNAALLDSEKEQALTSSQNLSQNSVMNDITSIATGNVSRAGSASAGSDREILEGTCVTPERDRDWDKLSCSSLSEVSVACLQDRIMQMEETHYSTNEELQATLQELADLQAQLTELQSDNERLTEEKSVLLESLCRQTEKLEDSRTKVDTLQDLLLRDGQPDESGTPLPEREQKLVELLKSGQEEREALLLKQEELSTEVRELHTAAETHASECTRLTERVRLLESTVDATHAERKQLDQELALAKEESSSRHIEISRLTTLLENARAKIEELEQTRELGDRTEVEARLDAVRREKDVLEGQVASLQEQLSRSQCEVAKLREQLSTLQEECKVMRNNAKSARSDLEYQCEQLRREKTALTSEVQQLQDSTSQLQLQCQCHLEDKRQLKAALSETQRTSADLERRLNTVQTELTEERRLRKEEGVEWQQYQSDLLMTVRVANDFKTEAQHELEKLVQENKSLRDKVRTIETQIEKLKVGQEGKRRNDSCILKRGRSVTLRRTANRSVENPRWTKKKLERTETSSHYYPSLPPLPEAIEDGSLRVRSRKNVSALLRDTEGLKVVRAMPVFISETSPEVQYYQQGQDRSKLGCGVKGTEAAVIGKPSGMEYPFYAALNMLEARFSVHALDKRSDSEESRFWESIFSGSCGRNQPLEGASRVKAKGSSAQKCPSPTPVHPPAVLRSVSMSGALVSGSAVEDNVLSEISAVRRSKPSISRQDSRLSVKSLIESIENATKQAKTGPGGSRSSSTSSLSSIASEVRAAGVSTPTPTSPLRHLSLTDSEALFKAPLRDQQQSNNQNNNNNNHHHNNNNLHQNNRLAQQPRKNLPPEGGKPHTLANNEEALGLTNLSHHPALTTPVAILTSKSMDYARRNSCGDLSERKDPLAPLVKNGGSKRNALLKWCQNKTVGYRNIDITNFSSSWNDGLAFCALLHSYLPDRVPYETLTPNEKRRNFTIAFAAAESVGITTTLNINDMIQLERPDWQQIMAYVTAIYVHFET